MGDFKYKIGEHVLLALDENQMPIVARITNRRISQFGIFPVYYDLELYPCSSTEMTFIPETQIFRSVDNSLVAGEKVAYISFPRGEEHTGTIIGFGRGGSLFDREYAIRADCGGQITHLHDHNIVKVYKTATQISRECKDLFKPSHNVKSNWPDDILDDMTKWILDGDRITLGGRQMDVNIHSKEFEKAMEAVSYLFKGEDTMNIKNQIKDVIFNDPATIIKWTDGTKTVVKCGKNEEFDPEKGLAMGIAKKVLGNQGNYYDIFKKWLPEEEDSMSLTKLSDAIKKASDKLQKAFAPSKDCTVTAGDDIGPGDYVYILTGKFNGKKAEVISVGYHFGKRSMLYNVCIKDGKREFYASYVRKNIALV